MTADAVSSSATTGESRPVPGVLAARVEGVAKRFGATVALAGVDLAIPDGTVFGLLWRPEP